MKKTYQTITLNNEGVDRISELLQDRFRMGKVKEKNVQRARLAVETILLDLAARFGSDQAIVMVEGKFLGRRYIKLIYKGDPYDPMAGKGNSDFLNKFLSNISMDPVWSYHAEDKTNEIYIKIPRNEMKDEVILMISVVCAILMGLLGNILPENVRNILNDYVFGTVSTLFMNVLLAFAGIMVFLSIICGIIGIGNISDFSKMGKYLVGRLTGETFLWAAIVGAAVIPLHSFRFGEGNGSSGWKAIVDMVVGIVPKDPVTPFAEGNMLQIVFLAVITGIAVLILSRETRTLQDLMIQANNASMTIMGLISRLLPFYIFASLTMLIWQNGIGTFKTVWKPLLLGILIQHLIMFIKIGVTSVRCKVSPVILMKKTAASYLVGLSTASSSAALGLALETNEKKLGVAKDMSNFGQPLANILNCSTTAMAFVCLIYYLAEINGTPVNIGWFICVIVGVSILSFAMPPVPGGTLICLGVMLAQFGIPADYLPLAGTIAMIIDFPLTASRLVTSHMELVLESKHWKTLDSTILKDR